MTTDTRAPELVDLLLEDPEWVDREFEALVATGFDDAGPPVRPAPVQGSPRPRRPGPGPVRRLAHSSPGREPEGPGRAHQRGPPRDRPGPPGEPHRQDHRQNHRQNHW